MSGFLRDYDISFWIERGRSQSETCKTEPVLLRYLSYDSVRLIYHDTFRKSWKCSKNQLRIVEHNHA